MAPRTAVVDRAPDPMNVEKFKAWLDGNDRSPSGARPQPSQGAAGRPGSRQDQQPVAPSHRTVDPPGSLADKVAKVFGIKLPSLLQPVLSVKQGRMSAEYGVADVGVRTVRAFSNR